MGLKSKVDPVVEVEEEFAPYMGLKSILSFGCTLFSSFAPYMGLKSNYNEDR